MIHGVLHSWHEPQFMLVPSLICPASCTYCFGPRGGPKLNISNIGGILGFMESVLSETGQKKAKVTLHGGEPLAAGYPVIEALMEDMLHRFGSNGYSVNLQSNLWLLDNKYCELFKKHKVDIGTSLDGPEELNDRQRGEGYFKKTIAGIKLARSYGLDVGCIATFTPQTAERWREVFDFFLETGLHFSIHPSIPSLDNSSGFELSSDRYGALLCDMLDYYLLNRQKIKISSLDQLCQAVASGTGRVCTFQDCFGMFLVIDPLGDIYSCQRLAGRPEYRLGSIDDKPSLRQLSESAAAQMFNRCGATINETCRECSHYPYCKGGCPYNTWADGGDITAPDPYCEAYRVVFDYIRQRLDEEMASEENIEAIAMKGLAEDGHPLMRIGPITELTREHSHPFQTARTAKAIVAAVELARHGDVPATALRLHSMGISRTRESGEASLRGLMERMHVSAALNNLYLHLTFDCQLHCTHCYAHAGESVDGEQQEMSITAIKRLILEAVTGNFRQIVISGGEPLLHTQRSEMLLMLASLRKQISPLKLALRSNFSMPLNAADLALIANAFEQVIVSVDGGEKEHDLRRGAGSYSKLLVNLEAYTKYCHDNRRKSGSLPFAELSLAAVLRAADIKSDTGREIQALASRLGVSRTRFRPILPLGRAQEWNEPPTSEALGCHLDPLEMIEHGFQPVSSCGLGQNLYVEPSGESFPCYAYHQPHSYLGNVISDGLNSVINSAAFTALRHHTVDTNHKCSSCLMHYLCGGACRAWSGDAAQHDLDAPPSECNGLWERSSNLYKAALKYLALKDESPKSSVINPNHLSIF